MGRDGLAPVADERAQDTGRNAVVGGYVLVVGVAGDEVVGGDEAAGVDAVHLVEGMDGEAVSWSRSRGRPGTGASARLCMDWAASALDLLLLIARLQNFLRNHCELSQSSHAEFGADGGGDGGGVEVHEGFGFGLDHDAGEGFGAGVADDDAAGVGERGLGGGDGGGDGGDVVERGLLADVDVDDDLGEGLEVGGQLGQCLA